MDPKSQKTFINVLLGVIILLSSFSFVLADSSDTSTPPSFAGIGIIITIVMLFQISKSEKIAIEEANGNRVGIAGWLFFFIGLIAISGSIVLLRIVSDIFQLIVYGPSLFLSFSFIFTEFLDLVSGVAFIFVAYSLWKIKPNAKYLAIGVLVFDILIIGINWLVVVDELYLALSFFTLFWNIIMIMYFSISRRVKYTYTKNAKIPKKQASSNKTVKGWIIFQAIMTILLFVLFQFISWEETAEYKGGYYFGCDENSNIRINLDSILSESNNVKQNYELTKQSFFLSPNVDIEVQRMDKWIDSYNELISSYNNVIEGYNKYMFFADNCYNFSISTYLDEENSYIDSEGNLIDKSNENLIPRAEMAGYVYGDSSSVYPF